MTKNLDYYLNLAWSYNFEWDPRSEHYVVHVKEIKGCKSCGKTIEEAATMIKDALKECLETMLEFNDPIPEPANLSDFKGNILYRTTPEMHYKIVQRAELEGVSINKLIDELIKKEIA